MTTTKTRKEAESVSSVRLRRGAKPHQRPTSSSRGPSHPNEAAPSSRRCSPLRIFLVLASLSSVFFGALVADLLTGGSYGTAILAPLVTHVFVPVNEPDLGKTPVNCCLSRGICMYIKGIEKKSY